MNHVGSGGDERQSRHCGRPFTALIFCEYSPQTTAGANVTEPLTVTGPPQNLVAVSAKCRHCGFLRRGCGEPRLRSGVASQRCDLLAAKGVSGTMTVRLVACQPTINYGIAIATGAQVVFRPRLPRPRRLLFRVTPGARSCRRAATRRANLSLSLQYASITT